MNDPTARGPPWTDAAIARLRQAILDDALGRLERQRIRNQDRRALIAWVLSDALHSFSFRVCAAAGGYDADGLRGGLLRRPRSQAG